MGYTEHQKALLRKLDEERERLSAAMPEGEELSWNEFAKKIGLTGSALSQIRAGKYGANPKKQFDAIDEYFRVKDQAKLTYKELKYVPTSISSEICDVIAICQVSGGMTVIVGDSGIGKTKAAVHYVKEHSNSVLITLNACFRSLSALLRLIAKAVGAKVKSSKDALWESILERLNDGMILIFDEAQFLSPIGIDTLRSFSDEFERRGETLGICLIGNPVVESNFDGRNVNLDQLKNRTHLHKKYTREDIRMMFPILVDENREAEIELLYKFSKTQQAIRGTVHLFSYAYNNDTYYYDGLLAAIKEVEAEV